MRSQLHPHFLPVHVLVQPIHMVLAGSVLHRLSTHDHRRIRSLVVFHPGQDATAFAHPVGLPESDVLSLGHGGPRISGPRCGADGE